MDCAEEVEGRALLCRDLQVDRLALLAGAGQAGVAGTVDVRRGGRADAVLGVLELRLRVGVVRVDAELARDLVADLAVEGLSSGARELALLDHREQIGRASCRE